MKKNTYHPRHPEKTPLYDIVREHYNPFRESYNEKYGDTYGFFRPEIDREMKKYKKCGIPKHGFAIVRCPNYDCGNEYILPFSCKGRGICPSCLQKLMLETGSFITETIVLASETPARRGQSCTTRNA